MKKYGVLLNMLITSLLMLVFFGKLISNLNTTLFAKGGDGTRAYYVAMYHAKYDSGRFMRTDCMNYPYGENIYYTDSQLLISSLVKLIKPLADLSEYMIGIINFLMLAGIFLGSLFLYLIFRKLDIHPLIATLLAVGISFLSPQLDRMGGHFSLAYICFIPAIFYFLHEYYQKKNTTNTSIITIIGILAIGTHLYLFAIYAMIIFFYWLSQLPALIRNFNLKYLVHCLVQLVLPLVLFKIFFLFSDLAHDRASYPYGFLSYRAYPESVFLPVYKPYLKFITAFFKNTTYLEWEGRSYIGMVASLVSIVLIIKICVIAFKTRFKFSISTTGNSILDFVFLSSFFILLFSFGFPFIIGGLEKWVEYLGPFRQVRAPGRFAWVFYYASNIIAFSILYKWQWIFRKINISRMLFYFALTVLLYESYIKIQPIQESRFNKNLFLTDYLNSLPENQRISELKNSNYKAIIPIPFFHIGAEYISTIPSDNLINFTYLVSIKTGIPITGMIAARSSLSETRNQFQLIYQPVDFPEILSKYEKGDYLLIEDTTSKPTLTQINQIRASTFIGSYDQFNLYKISLSELKNFYIKEVNFNREKYCLTDSSLCKECFQDNSEMSLPKQSFTLNADEVAEWKTILDTPVNMVNDTMDFYFGFWIGPFTEDLLLKTQVKLYFTDDHENIVYLKEFQPNSRIITIYRNNALIGITVPYSDKYSNVTVMIRNKRMTKQLVYVKGFYVLN
jgi:hypothetical protein